MEPALDLGINLIVFFTLFALAICVFSLPSGLRNSACLRKLGTTTPTFLAMSCYCGSAPRRRETSKSGLSKQHADPRSMPGESIQATDVLQELPSRKGHRYVGVVQRYSERNGIGFIACAPSRAAYGRDVQLFQEDWEALELSVGTAVSFQLSVEERFPCPKGRPWAADVQRAR
mmetsp:Transcript_54829/g.102705  ORF Transcript_54829/g.102705 Transcript_54829/m.102705 type:complete len:174 (+) Transcript_54829:137-658(+)